MREQLNQRLLDLESEQEAANGDVQRAMEQLEELSNELHEAREGQTTEQADEALEEAVWEPQLVIEATSPTSVAIVLGGKQSAPAQQQPEANGAEEAVQGAPHAAESEGMEPERGMKDVKAAGQEEPAEAVAMGSGVETVRSVSTRIMPTARMYMLRENISFPRRASKEKVGNKSGAKSPPAETLVVSPRGSPPTVPDLQVVKIV